MGKATPLAFLNGLQVTSTTGFLSRGQILINLVPILQQLIKQ